jgi:dimethylglycine dehydrogenase
MTYRGREAPPDDPLDQAERVDRKRRSAGRQIRGAKRKLCALIVDAAEAYVVAWEPSIDGSVQGYCTSGGYAHFTGKPVALGFIPTLIAVERLVLEIEISGERRAARLVTEPLLDTKGARMRR